MNSLIDSRQLRGFVTLARTGSFTIAAREIYLSQSAVSHSLKALEQDVGCRLFDRVGKNVILTQAGETLLYHAEKILNEMAGARSAIDRLGKWGKGRIRIGASSAICQYLLPRVLGEFKDSIPNCLITIESADAQDSVELLRANKIDLAITLEPMQDREFEFHELFVDKLLFFVEPKHPWAAAGHAVREEIPRQKYILYNKTSETFRMIQRYFQHEGMVLNAVIDFGSMEAIKELVKLGLGISILSPWVARQELANQSLVALPLGRRRLKRHWGVLYRSQKRLSLAEETFIGLCRSTTETLEQRKVA